MMIIAFFGMAKLKNDVGIITILDHRWVFFKLLGDGGRGRKNPKLLRAIN